MILDACLILLALASIITAMVGLARHWPNRRVAIPAVLGLLLLLPLPGGPLYCPPSPVPVGVPPDLTQEQVERIVNRHISSESLRARFGHSLSGVGWRGWESERLLRIHAINANRGGVDIEVVPVRWSGCWNYWTAKHVARTLGRAIQDDLDRIYDPTGEEDPWWWPDVCY